VSSSLLRDCAEFEPSFRNGLLEAFFSNAVASGDPSTTANVTGPGAAVALWVGTSGSEAGVAFTGVSSEDHDAAVTVTNGRNAVAHENGLATETPRTFSGSSTLRRDDCRGDMELT
jgi:hypothetical protein